MKFYAYIQAGSYQFYFHYPFNRCDGLGLILPVMADLIAELKHIPINEASTYGALLLSVFAITQFYLHL